jgi:hypothetical protein
MEKLCSQFRACTLKRHTGFRSKRPELQAVLRAAGETGTAQGNIQHWFQLYEGDPGLELLTEEDIAAVRVFIHFSSSLSTLGAGSSAVAKTLPYNLEGRGFDTR